ncbi:MAG TPA: hypothetical protein VFU21_20925 [Kofleriaceae bacterium]|jgi:hypothetical protein|nr:hypothetical protein [Kofleriaceae bacterium]
MPKLPELTDKQEELIEKGLRASWVLGVGAVLILIAFVVLLAKMTPTPLGQ